MTFYRHILLRFCLFFSTLYFSMLVWSACLSQSWKCPSPAWWHTNTNYLTAGVFTESSLLQAKTSEGETRRERQREKFYLSASPINFYVPGIKSYILIWVCSTSCWLSSSRTPYLINTWCKQWCILQGEMKSIFLNYYFHIFGSSGSSFLAHHCWLNIGKSPVLLLS